MPTLSSRKDPWVGWTPILTSVGAFVTALDVVVVSPALPTLRTDFRASLSEALLNVHRHAKASNVVVRLTGQSGVLVAGVVDDGVSGAVMRPGGGLHGADDRIRSRRGQLTVTSVRGRGTELTVTLPLDEVSP